MIEKLLEYLLYFWQNRESVKTLGGIRSPEWSKVREAYIKEHPTCEVCGKTEQCQVHHKLPFHLHPELELNPTNFITLCEGSGNHHLWFGHLGNFKSFNKDVMEDSNLWNIKIKSRP